MPTDRFLGVRNDWPEESEATVDLQEVSIRKLHDINQGTFGTKMMARIESDGDMNGTFFVKPSWSESSIKKQLEDYDFFKQRGVVVPSFLRKGTLENGKLVTIINDLTENGKYRVISTDDRDPALVSVGMQIPEATCEKLKKDLTHAANVAVRLEENLDASDWIYELNPQPFILQIDPKNPSDTHVYVGDFEGDVRQQNWDGEQMRIFEKNITNAAAFYSWVTGRPFSLPTDHPLAHLNTKFPQWNANIREDRGFNRMQKLHDLADTIP